MIFEEKRIARVESVFFLKENEKVDAFGIQPDN
jgi:hypothetical protein